jgi:lysylphosphatidylglycerol synthetase-like protein (DUF2156 family)
MFDIAMIVLMIIPNALAIAGLITVMTVQGSKGLFRAMKLQASAAIVQIIYAFIIAIPLDWEWVRLATALMFACGAFMWHTFGNAASKVEAEATRRENRHQELETKKLAEDLGLPWVDVLTAEREQVKLIADLEKTYLEGKQNGMEA